jgi:hypothetical protein
VATYFQASLASFLIAAIAIVADMVGGSLLTPAADVLTGEACFQWTGRYFAGAA